jgi:hypothetical protein
MDLKELLGDAYKENMTLTDIAAALKDKTFVDPSTLPESVSKETYNKVSTEAANLRKQLKEKSTTEEQAAAAQQEIQNQITALQKENSQFKFEKEFLASGYDAKTAASLAEAMAGGDMKKFAEVHAKYVAAHEAELQASIKADLLKNTPGLQGGGAGGGQGGEQPSAGELAAQAYNAQFGVAPAATAAGAQGK